MTPVLLVPPVSEPVSLDETKAWLRLDTSDEDAVVSSLIVAARCAIEAATRRLLVTQTWRLSLDGWGARSVASPLHALAQLDARTTAIPLAPVASLAAIRVYDAAGAPQTLPSAAYQVLGAPDNARLLFLASPPTPGRSAAGIEIDVVAGFGAPADVPPPLRQAMLMLVATWFENRGDDTAAGQRGLPPSVASLIAPFCRPRLV